MPSKTYAMKETRTITKPASGHARESPSRVDTTRWLSNAAGRRIACAHSGTAFTQPDTIAYACNIRGELMNAVSNVDANYAYSYDYAPFGAEIVPVGVEAEDSTTVHYSLSPIRCSNPWRFSSEFTDDELGCDYYIYREYEPVTGRWMQRDLIDEVGGDCLYAFVSNASVMDNDVLGQFDAKDVLSSGLCFVACYFGFTVDEIRDLYYAWTAPEKLPRHVRRTFELEARKHITGSKSRSDVSSSEMQKAIKELGYKKLRNKLSGKAGGKALKALAPNAVPVIGQVVSMLMTASEVWSVCRCAWACSVSKFF